MTTAEIRRSLESYRSDLLRQRAVAESAAEDPDSGTSAIWESIEKDFGPKLDRVERTLRRALS